MGPANKPEKAPQKTEKLKKIPPPERKCLGCNGGFVWDDKRGRKIKCKGCNGKGLI